MLAHKMVTWGIRAAQGPPPRDTHPLAREDGGWYPGKRFDPTDILTDPKNWTVWKQFLIFFFSMIFAPVGSFFLFDFVLRYGFKLKIHQSQTISALLAMFVLQGLMYTYARLSALENTEDYEKLQAEKKKEAQKLKVTETTEKTVEKTAEKTPEKTPEKTATESVMGSKKEGSDGKEDSTHTDTTTTQRKEK